MVICSSRTPRSVPVIIHTRKSQAYKFIVLKQDGIYADVRYKIVNSRGIMLLENVCVV